MIGYQFIFDEKKNDKLKKERNISFEEIICLIEMGNVLDVLEHPNQAKYGGQKIFVLENLYMCPCNNVVVESVSKNGSEFMGAVGPEPPGP